MPPRQKDQNLSRVLLLKRRDFCLSPRVVTDFAVSKAGPLDRLGVSTDRSRLNVLGHLLLLFLLPFRPDLATGPNVSRLACENFPQLHPLVAPQVSHFSQVPLRTMVKLEHSMHMLPV